MEEEQLKECILRSAKKLAKQAGGYGPVLEFTIKNGSESPFSISYRFDESGDDYDRKKANECLSAFAHLLSQEIKKTGVQDGKN